VPTTTRAGLTPPASRALEKAFLDALVPAERIEKSPVKSLCTPTKTVTPIDRCT
jgi:hypothetical protein